MATMNLHPSDFQAFDALVSRKTGLKIDKNRHSEIAQTLNDMLKTAKLSTFQELRDILSDCETNDLLWRQLIERVTIGETYFFRDAAQCNVLQTTVLPDLIAKRRTTGFKHLSLWSAGCATGEEPYTLAIMLREMIPDIVDWTFSILATDINLTSLETARKGIYRPHSFRQETRPDVQGRWFVKHENSFELDSSVRKMVEFAPLNFLSDDYPSFESRTMNLDLIICRNVTIYFEQATTRRIIERFHSCLNSEGWLVVGHAEPLVSAYEGFVPRNFHNAVLYQKQAEQYQPLSTEPAPRAMPVDVSQDVIAYLPVVKAQLVDAMIEARTAAGREDWETVKRALLMAERQNAMNPQVHYLRGLMLMQQNELDHALRALRRAIYCDSSFVLAHYALGELYEKRGNSTEAMRCWMRSQRTIAELQPQDKVAPGEDLTVEMFRDLLNYRLGSLPKGG
jgi:chemotaxis protein methyltransferase CheR